MLVEQLTRLVLRDARRHGDELARHEHAHRLVEVLFEANVSRRQDADRVLSLDDGNATDLVLAHYAERLPQRLARPHRDRPDDHPALRALHLFDLARLVGDRQILVHDPDAPFARDGDRGPRLGDRVHRRAEQRDVEEQLLGESGANVDLGRQDVAVSRHEEDVIERQMLPQLVFEHRGL